MNPNHMIGKNVLVIKIEETPTEDFIWHNEVGKPSIIRDRANLKKRVEEELDDWLSTIDAIAVDESHE